ncbi:hypothetical protein GIB67_012684 [Kingdonia uniflora]|uniref:Uncharacterized protein n=1 Tax=Kingdonia uniflora TaxID=39325 RepID=A0A7J7NF54_9MAGN|nr:hypothetical protein GIB67_012684 [Kingdonia uniflora]
MLVDIGSVADALFLQTIRAMKKTNMITPANVELIGFNGSTEVAVGRISLPITTGLITLQTKFLVIDKKSYKLIDYAMGFPTPSCPDLAEFSSPIPSEAMMSTLLESVGSPLIPVTKKASSKNYKILEAWEHFDKKAIKIVDGTEQIRVVCHILCDSTYACLLGWNLTHKKYANVPYCRLLFEIMKEINYGCEAIESMMETYKTKLKDLFEGYQQKFCNDDCDPSVATPSLINVDDMVLALLSKRRASSSQGCVSDLHRYLDQILIKGQLKTTNLMGHSISDWRNFKNFFSCVSSAARAKLDFKLVRVSWYQSDLVESDLVTMGEGPNATDPAQVLSQQVGGPSVNPRPLNTRTRLDQLEDKMQALSGIIDQVTTLEERLDGFSDDQAHVGERLVTLEGVVEGNMATFLDQSSSQSQQRAGSSNNYNKGKNGGYQARSGGDQGHGQNRSGGASAGGASSSNSGREYHRPGNNGGASSSSRFQGRPGNLKCFLCGGNHKAYQCPQKTALNALMASHGGQADDTTQGNDGVNLSRIDCKNLLISVDMVSDAIPVLDQVGGVIVI